MVDFNDMVVGNEEEVCVRQTLLTSEEEFVGHILI